MVEYSHWRADHLVHDHVFYGEPVCADRTCATHTERPGNNSSSRCRVVAQKMIRRRIRNLLYLPGMPKAT